MLERKKITKYHKMINWQFGSMAGNLGVSIVRYLGDQKNSKPSIQATVDH